MTRARRAHKLGLVAGLAVLWALYLPSANARGWSLDPRLSVALLAILALLALLALAGRQLFSWLRWLLAALLVLLATLQFADAAVEQILDRPLDLYFDLRHVPNLLGLYMAAAGWRGVATVAGGSLAVPAIFFLVARALAAIERAMERPPLAARSLAAAVLGLSFLALPFGRNVVETKATSAAWGQASAAWRAFAVLHGLDHRYDAALSTPQPAPGPLPGLQRRDVYLIFIESYGTVALDEPAYRAVIAPALDEFAATVKSAGYQLVSSRLVSPTYGGGSWLAHGTLASGLKLDPLLNELVLNGARKSLPRYLAAAGYRTVEFMPGIKKPYPEGAFWGFDKNYYAAELGYAGPEFGWFDIPDQYTLGQFSARELTPGHPPLFAQLVLVSSHTPFAPVPPYLADWSDARKFDTVTAEDWPRIYAPPDWNNLDRPYLDSIAYDLKTLGAWLARLDNDALVIILGDHQPPELTSGTDHPWSVPIHVLSRDPDLVRPFLALGYAAGALPPPIDKPEGMEKFLGEFLAAYGACSASHDSSGLNSALACAARDVSPPLSTPRQSPDAQAAFRP